MEIFAEFDSFDIAEAAIKDYLIKKNLNSSNPEEMKLLKLLQAREQNPKFEYDLALMICGEEGNSFPYRSSYYLTQFFKNLGFSHEHDGSTRKFWVEKQLKKIDIKGIRTIIQKGLFNKYVFKTEAQKLDLDHIELFNTAISEFQNFIDNSLFVDEELDLAHLLNMNVNTDLLFNQNFQTNDTSLNALIKESKERYLKPRDKHIALEKIWDAFERIKTYYIPKNKKKSVLKLTEVVTNQINSSVIAEEFTILTKIGNEYKIRHHEIGKKEITDPAEVDYLFFRVLSLLDLCIRKIKEHGN